MKVCCNMLPVWQNRCSVQQFNDTDLLRIRTCDWIQAESMLISRREQEISANPQDIFQQHHSICICGATLSLHCTSELRAPLFTNKQEGLFSMKRTLSAQQVPQVRCTKLQGTDCTDKCKFNDTIIEFWSIWRHLLLIFQICDFIPYFSETVHVLTFY